MYEAIITAAVVLTVLSLILSLFRFLKGPMLATRVVAFDVIGFIAISLIAFCSLYFDRVIYLDTALVYGLLSFLGVVVVARYIERGL